MKKSICFIAGMILTTCSVCSQTTPESESSTAPMSGHATDSLKTIIRQAEQGNAIAQNVVGTWYYKGEHYTQNYTKAAQWWSLAAKQDNVEAIGNLGLLYQYGYGVAIDSLKAMKYYLASINSGNLDLLHQREALAGKPGDRFNCVLCALCYQEGKGVAKNSAKAVSFYKTAAKNGSIDAVRELGFIYQRRQDHDTAKKLFKRAAESGDIPSTYQYAKIFLQTTGNDDKKEEAIVYLMKAAQAGHPQAQCDLGLLYHQGRFVTKDPANAVKWLTLSAISGWPQAQWNLALCLIEGTGVSRDYDKAVYWLGEATAKGYMPQFEKMCADNKNGWKGQTFMDYLTGLSLYFSEAKDINGAYDVFRKIKKQSVEAQIMMSVCLAHRNYPKNNPKKAVSELNKIAESGHPVAQFYLATLYEAGNGVDKNAEKALKWYQASANGGYAVAQCYMGNLFYEGRIVHQSDVEAVRYYQMAESQGQLTETAAIRYAQCLKEGRGGLDADETKAQKLKGRDFRNHVLPMLHKLN